MPVTNPTDQDVSMGFLTGVLTVGATITRIRSGSSIPMGNGLTVLADKDNEGVIYFSPYSDMVIDDSDPDKQGMPLEAGDSFQIQVDNVNKVYFKATEAGQKLRYAAE